MSEADASGRRYAYRTQYNLFILEGASAESYHRLCTSLRDENLLFF